MIKKLKIQPLSDFVFLQWEKKKETEKGVILSDTSKSKPAIAEVIGIGPGEIDKSGSVRKTILKVGDIIVVDPFVPQVIKVEGVEYLVCREKEIFAKICGKITTKQERA